MNGVGVEDKSHFAREFKKAYGLTPTAYRAAHLVAEEVKKACTRQIAETANR
jgi:AraC-like DNA-binding protein